MSRGGMVGYERIVQSPNHLIVEQISNVKVVAGKLFDSRGCRSLSKEFCYRRIVILRHLQRSEAGIRWLVLDEDSGE